MDVFSLGFIGWMVNCNAGVLNLLLFRFLCVCISVISDRSIFNISGFRGLSCRRLQQNHSDINCHFFCDFTAMQQHSALHMCNVWKCMIINMLPSEPYINDCQIRIYSCVFLIFWLMHCIGLSIKVKGNICLFNRKYR